MDIKKDVIGIVGGMGSYAQRGGKDFMIRLRIPSGIMSIDKFKTVYEIAKKQNLDYTLLDILYLCSIFHPFFAIVYFMSIFL